MKVKFKVSFMDWRAGDIEDLDKDIARSYIESLKVATPYNERQKKVKTAPKNRMATGARAK